jgi:predicted small lipoprotein YifL
MQKNLVSLVAVAALPFLSSCGSSGPSNSPRDTKLEPGVYAGEVQCGGNAIGTTTYTAAITINEDGLPNYGPLVPRLGPNRGLPFFAGNISDLILEDSEYFLLGLNNSQSQLTAFDQQVNASHYSNAFVEEIDATLGLTGRETFRQNDSALDYMVSLDATIRYDDGEENIWVSCDGKLEK